MRGEQYVSNFTPLVGSKASMASINPNIQVVKLNLTWQFAVQPLGAIFHQVPVVLHKKIAMMVVAGFVELFPNLLDIECLLSFHRIRP
jgi:hypothetical protein